MSIRLPGMKPPKIVQKAVKGVEDLIALSADRMKICTDCEHFTGTKCDQCGCFMRAKTKIPQARCPLGKW